MKKITANHINHEQWQQIAEQVPNLEIIETGCKVINENDVDRVVQFIETCKNLKTIRFFDGMSRQCESILQRLQPNWKLIQDNMTFSFTRI